MKRHELEKWDDVDPLSISDAAFLWCRQVPMPDFSSSPQAYQTAKRIWSKASELSLLASQTRFNPSHELPRADFTRIAEILKETPHFLFPANRRRTTGWSEYSELRYRVFYEVVEKLMKQKGCNKTRAVKLAAKTPELEGTKESTIARGHYRYKEHLRNEKGFR